MRLCVVATAVLVLTACGGRPPTSMLPSPSGPLVATREPTPASQAPITYPFVVDLRSSNEVPPIVDEEASCTGEGRLFLRATRDSTGKLTAATAQFSLLLRGCPTGTRITLAHIHEGTVGQVGAVRIDSGLKATAPIALRGGEMGINQPDVTVSDLGLVADIVANPGGYYLNVHSMLHPDGLLRGQLAPGM